MPTTHSNMYRNISPQFSPRSKSPVPLPLSLDTLCQPTAMDGEGVELMDALRDLITTGKYSDLTIVCGEKKFIVNRQLLSARSGFFDRACRHPFRESITGVIHLEDDPEAVEHMISYFQNLDYLPSAPLLRQRSLTLESLTTNTTISTQQLSPSLDVPETPGSTGTSGYFNVPAQRRKLTFTHIEDPLLAMAAVNQPKVPENPFLTRFGPTSPLTTRESISLPVKTPELPPPIDTFIAVTQEERDDYNVYDDEEVPDQEPIRHRAHLVTHAKVYALAEQYGIRGLKALAKKKYAAQVAFHRESSEFAESLREVYDGTVETDRGLRDVVISTFRKFPEVAQRKDVGEVVKETPALAYELFRMAWGLPLMQ